MINTYTVDIESGDQKKTYEGIKASTVLPAINRANRMFLKETNLEKLSEIAVTAKATQTDKQAEVVGIPKPSKSKKTSLKEAQKLVDATAEVIKTPEVTPAN